MHDEVHRCTNMHDAAETLRPSLSPLIPSPGMCAHARKC